MKRQRYRRTTFTVAFHLELFLLLAERTMPLGDDVPVLWIVNPVRRNKDAEAVPVIRECRHAGQGNFRAEGTQPARNLETHGMPARPDRIVDDANAARVSNGFWIVFLSQGILIAINAEVPLRLEPFSKPSKNRPSLAG